MVNPTAPAGRRVLVIEDHVDAAEMLEMALTVFGHEVRLASDGAQALAVAREFQPDVVLCDIGLPGMSGYDVARSLREEPATRSSFLVALTGYGRDEDGGRCGAAGFDLHIVKPVDVTRLQDLLRSRQ